MSLVPAPKAIVVALCEVVPEKEQLGSFICSYEGYAKILRRARTQHLVHECVLSSVSRSPLGRMLRRGRSHESQVQRACQFVADNYRTGDYVMLFGWMMHDKLGDPQYVGLQQLAKALDKGSPTDASGSNMASRRIPIKCVCINFKSYKNLLWAGFDQVFSDFPSTVENMFCLSSHGAYTVQRGLNGQIKRKEVWLSDDGFHEGQLRWMVALQTSHIIDYNPDDLRKARYYFALSSSTIDRPQLVKSMVQLNCTKRRKGLPHDGAIPTGGQLTRVSRLQWPGTFKPSESFVWSSQSFTESEYSEVCNTPLAGPQRAAQKKSGVTWFDDLRV
ncbi:hypothetical protein BDV93DRAFT_529791 [Ceratobasidium sp. AG-I]|nr:hypothetical protein BDV93DRAFT_529791 [Ceratobasidium sp. AG-I]